MWRRISIATGIGIISSVLCWLLLSRFSVQARDFDWPLRAARDLLAGRDPYNYAFHEYAIPYPLPAALVALPFAWLPNQVAGALFIGLSSALLAFGLTKHGYARLLIFLAYPYWDALIFVQWSPLIMAAAFFPLLLPVALAKPQIALPIALTHLSRRGFWACVVVGIASLLVLPDWPLRWLGQINSYQSFVPLLVLPGPLLLLALLRRRDKDAQMLMLAAVMPQRWLYDSFILWLIPKSPREILITAGISWVAPFWRYFFPYESVKDVHPVIVVCCYMPILVVVLLRHKTIAQSNSLR